MGTRVLYSDSFTLVYGSVDALIKANGYECNVIRSFEKKKNYYQIQTHRVSTIVYDVTIISFTGNVSYDH